MHILAQSWVTRGKRWFSAPTPTPHKSDTPERRLPERGPTLLFVIDGLDLGGAQQLLVVLGRALVEQGWRVLVCCLQPKLDLLPRLREAGVEVHCLGRPRPGVSRPVAFLRYVLGGLWDIGRLLVRERVDILHAHLSDAEFLGLAAGLVCRTPVVMATIHSPRLLPERSRRSLRNRLRVFLSRTLFNAADWIVAVSEEAASNLISVFGVASGRVVVIENCVAFGQGEAPPGLREALGIPAGARVLAAVGRLDPVKNHALLLEAMAALPRRDVVLLLVGAGGLEDELRRQASALGLADRVLFLGLREDVARLLRIVDVFIMPSKYEGTSLALLEAMAAGRPIVATDIPGNRKPLIDGAAALLVPPDDANALARAIHRLLDDQRLARTLGDKARQTAQKRYSVESAVNRLERLRQTARRRLLPLLRPRSLPPRKQ